LRVLGAPNGFSSACKDFSWEPWVDVSLSLATQAMVFWSELHASLQVVLDFARNPRHLPTCTCGSLWKF